MRAVCIQYQLVRQAADSWPHLYRVLPHRVLPHEYWGRQQILCLTCIAACSAHCAQPHTSSGPHLLTLRRSGGGEQLVSVGYCHGAIAAADMVMSYH